MAEIIQQTIDQMTHYPTGMERPAMVAGAIALTAAAVALQTHRFNKTEEQFAVDNYAGSELMKTTLIPDSKANRRGRLRSPRLELVGLGLAAAALLAQPTYETSIPDETANVVVVDDMSSSMLLARDLSESGVSRSQAVNAGLFSADYKASLAVVQTAEGNKIVLPLTKNWEVQRAVIEKPAVKPNGGALVAGLELAASALPLSKDGTKRDGNIIILSDGTIDDDPSAVTAEAQKLKDQGITVKVIVPGSEAGTYTLTEGSAPVKAGANPSRFAGFGEDNVVATNDVNKIEAAVRSAVESSGSTSEQHPWNLPLYAGIGLLAAGFVMNQYQRSKRVV